MGAPPYKSATVAQMHRVQMTFDGFASLALTEVDLEIRRGEIFGLIGPQGSGKSLMVMLLAGRLKPSFGKVKVFGSSPCRSSIRRRIGYLAQNGSRPRRGMLGLLRRILPRSKTPATAVPKSLRIDQLLIKKPDVILLDEPFGDLDADGVREMMERIAAMSRQGTTVILSDRWLSPAKDLCGRMAVLFRGQIQAVGSMTELMASPEALRVLGPVLRAESAEKVLTVMRREILTAGGDFRENLRAPEPVKTSTDSTSIIAALTRPGSTATAEELPGKQTDSVDYLKLEQLTKLSKKQ